jgi:hypothetical protein
MDHCLLTSRFSFQRAVGHQAQSQVSRLGSFRAGRVLSPVQLAAHESEELFNLLALTVKAFDLVQAQAHITGDKASFAVFDYQHRNAITEHPLGMTKSIRPVLPQLLPTKRPILFTRVTKCQPYNRMCLSRTLALDQLSITT